LVDLYLVRLKIKSNGPDTLARNQREMKRLVQFAASHERFLAGDLDKGFLLRYADTWEEFYPSA